MIAGREMLPTLAPRKPAAVTVNCETIPVLQMVLGTRRAELKPEPPTDSPLRPSGGDSARARTRNEIRDLAALPVTFRVILLPKTYVVRPSSFRLDVKPNSYRN